MSTRICAGEREAATPTAAVGEAMWIAAVDALVIVVLTLVFSCIAATENELTTWPMPSGRICTPAGVRSCVVAAGIHHHARQIHRDRRSRSAPTDLGIRSDNRRMAGTCRAVLLSGRGQCDHRRRRAGLSPAWPCKPEVFTAAYRRQP